MIRVNEIKTPLEGTYDDVLAGAAKALRISKRKILSLEIVRKSLDSRKKENLFFVHSVDVTVDGDEKEILAKSRNKKAAIVEPILCPNISEQVSFVRSLSASVPAECGRR